MSKNICLWIIIFIIISCLVSAFSELQSSELYNGAKIQDDIISRSLGEGVDLQENTSEVNSVTALRIPLDEVTVMPGFEELQKPGLELARKFVSYTSLSGNALTSDPLTVYYGNGREIGYLVTGAAIAFQPGDAFCSAPVQLPHGAKITGFDCVVRDNTTVGYIDALLLRGPINTDYSEIESDIIASEFTNPSFSQPDYVVLSDGFVDQKYTTVDNTRFGYYLDVRFIDNPICPGSHPCLGFRGCVIEYVMP